MKQILEFPTPSTRWDKVASAARIARNLLPLWDQHQIRSRHLLPLLETAISVAEARAEVGDGEVPLYDPSLPVQLSDEGELIALGRCLEAIYESAKNLLADAFCYAEPEDEFSREAIAYHTVVEAVRRAYRAAMAEGEAESLQWLEDDAA